MLFFLNIGGTPPEFVELEVTNINPGGGGTGTDRAESPGQDLTGASAAGGFGDVFGTLPGDLEGESSVEPLAAGVSQGAIDVELADMNGDTFVDLVIVSAHDDKIAWYRNTGTVQQRPLEQVITEDPDGTTVREYADTGEVVGPEGACGQREIWRCETDPQPSSPPLECSGACVLPAVGTCEFAPLKSCAFEACVGGLCATSGAECASAADCANAQCGEDVGPCRFSGTCDIPRPLLDPGPSDPVPPEPEPDLPPDLCSTELCIDSQCEFSGAPCSTNVDCEAEQCNFGPCEPFTRYTESIENVQEGVDHGPSAVVIADLDQDGDPDFVVSSVLGNTISWWENNGLPDAVFSRRPVNGALDGF